MGGTILKTSSEIFLLFPGKTAGDRKKKKD